VRRALICLCLFLASCSVARTPSPQEEFEDWLAAAPERTVSFQRFEALLQQEGVADVVPDRDLWLTDRKDAACVIEPYTMPLEQLWPRIVPALHYIRD
jgi:hypothetical protein